MKNDEQSVFRLLARMRREEVLDAFNRWEMN